MGLKRFTLGLVLWSVCSCSQSLDGQYVGPTHAVRIYQQGGQRFADVQPVEFGSKERVTLPLTVRGDSFIGEVSSWLFPAAALTLSRREDGLLVTAGPRTELLKRVDPARGGSSFTEAAAMTELAGDLASASLVLAKQGSCASSSLLPSTDRAREHRKAQRLVEELKAARIHVNQWTKQEGPFVDRYTVHGELELPGGATLFRDQEVCNPYLQGRSCPAWSSGTVLGSTPPSKVRFTVDVDAIRFPGAAAGRPALGWRMLGEDRLPGALEPKSLCALFLPPLGGSTPSIAYTEDVK